MRRVAAWATLWLAGSVVEASDWEAYEIRPVVLSAPQVLAVSPYSAAASATAASWEPAWRTPQVRVVPIGGPVGSSGFSNGAAQPLLQRIPAVTDNGPHVTPLIPAPEAPRVPADYAPRLPAESAPRVWSGADPQTSAGQTLLVPRYSLAPAPVWVPGARPPVLAPPIITYRPTLPTGTLPAEYQLGRGIYGQPKVYVPGQPVRNFLRSLTP